MTLEVIQGDITKLKVDAIVNAANSSLLGGGGVDGAIHRAGGKAILEACKRIRETDGRCEPGDAVVTTAGKLAATWVIHTVGPVWHGGGDWEEETLASCYRKVLELAEERGVKTIAVPNISTGVYRFPKARAAEIALRTVEAYINERGVRSLEKILFVCFDDENARLYWDALNQ
ncbi:MAG TPA: O-acetyl-ADP-ribose deacetylase [Bacillales bacterium]|nr:O-acetyl-ADP-ribose deacetylase [Bacillales bacterium]